MNFGKDDKLCTVFIEEKSKIEYVNLLAGKGSPYRVHLGYTNGQRVLQSFVNN